MQTIKASKFKKKCLSLIDSINETGDELIITKNGVPVCKLIPAIQRPKTLFGIDKNQLQITGEIMEAHEEEWEVLQ